jgi:pimeloyl-ACP methyl ester carboxylesterase/DNA-binding CsgD family transcriptional regulator
MLGERIHYARSADGARIAWTARGKGPRTLVQASTHLGDFKRDWDNPIAAPAQARLTQHFRVIRYDHRGSGSSQRNVQRQGQDAWVEDLEAVTRAANIREPFVLMAMSQAGPFAAVFAARNAARLSHLVIYGAAPNGPYASGNADSIAMRKAMVEMMRVGWSNDFPGPRRLVMNNLVIDATAEETEWFDRNSRAVADAEDQARFLEADGDCDARPYLSKIATPTLVMQADQDTCVIPEWSRAFAAGIPGAQYVEIPGKNHIPLERDPGYEHFFQHLFDFTLGKAWVDGPLAALSVREREILDDVCAGLSNEAIALRRNISTKTVRNHLTKVFDKLGVISRTQAVLAVHSRQRAMAE